MLRTFFTTCDERGGENFFCCVEPGKNAVESISCENESDAESQEFDLIQIDSNNRFKQIILSCRVITTILRRPTVRKKLFSEYQNLFNVQCGILHDVVTRFDSPLDMLSSVVRNKRLLADCKSETI